MSDDTIQFNKKELDAFIRALSGKLPYVRVGILGDKNARTGKGVNSNAVVGAAHEFGTTKLPRRSFLRMPIAERFKDYLDKSSAFDEDVVKKVIRSKSIVAWLQKVGIVAETTIADAFATGGFGRWKTSNMKHKKVQQTLVETQQLRNSITSDVRE